MVLVCVGRREFRDGLGVEEVGVAMDGRKIQAGARSKKGATQGRFLWKKIRRKIVRCLIYVHFYGRFFLLPHFLWSKASFLCQRLRGG